MATPLASVVQSIRSYSNLKLGQSESTTQAIKIPTSFATQVKSVNDEAIVGVMLGADSCGAKFVKPRCFLFNHFTVYNENNYLESSKQYKMPEKFEGFKYFETKIGRNSNGAILRVRFTPVHVHINDVKDFGTNFIDDFRTEVVEKSYKEVWTKCVDQQTQPQEFDKSGKNQSYFIKNQCSKKFAEILDLNVAAFMEKLGVLEWHYYIYFHGQKIMVVAEDAAQIFSSNGIDTDDGKPTCFKPDAANCLEALTDLLKNTGLNPKLQFAPRKKDADEPQDDDTQSTEEKIVPSWDGEEPLTADEFKMFLDISTMSYAELGSKVCTKTDEVHSDGAVVERFPLYNTSFLGCLTLKKIKDSCDPRMYHASIYDEEWHMRGTESPTNVVYPVATGYMEEATRLENVRKFVAVNNQSISRLNDYTDVMKKYPTHRFEVTTLHNSPADAVNHFLTVYDKNQIVPLLKKFIENGCIYKVHDIATVIDEAMEPELSLLTKTLADPKRILTSLELVRLYRAHLSTTFAFNSSSNIIRSSGKIFKYFNTPDKNENTFVFDKICYTTAGKLVFKDVDQSTLKYFNLQYSIADHSIYGSYLYEKYHVIAAAIVRAKQLSWYPEVAECDIEQLMDAYLKTSLLSVIHYRSNKYRKLAVDQFTITLPPCRIKSKVILTMIF